jgi:hypothetical protein
MDNSSTVTRDKLEGEKGTRSKIAKRPHHEQASKRAHVPLFRRRAVSEDISTDALLDGVLLHCHGDKTYTQYYREPIPKIDPGFSDNEDKDVYTCETMDLPSVPSTPLGDRSESSSSAASVSVDATKVSLVSQLSEASGLISDHELRVRSTSASSRTSLSSTDFQIERRQIEAPGAVDKALKIPSAHPSS